MEETNTQQNQSTQQSQPAQPPVASTPPPQQKPKTYSELEKKYQFAIDLRSLNYDYEIISKRLKKAGFQAEEQTVRTWFMKGGICYSVYEPIRQKREEELRQDINRNKDELQKGAVDAIAIIRTSLRTALETGEISEQDYANARDILDRAGYPKMSKTDFSGKIESEGMLAMAQAIKGVLEVNKPPVQQQPKPAQPVQQQPAQQTNNA